jgi:hypothetical protein
MMFHEKIHEKNLFKWVQNELDVLYSVRKIDGCVRVSDAYTD